MKSASDKFAPCGTSQRETSQGGTSQKMKAPLASHLSLENLFWQAGSFRLQVHLSLELSRFYTILGPSGCGKTTLLRLIAGLNAPGPSPGPEEGLIFLEGRDITGLPPHRRGIGMVFQHYSLFPHLSAGQNIGYGLERLGWNRSRRDFRIREMLSLVHLAGNEERRVDTLSGGEQQRIAIARALAPQPRLLLLDEPLSALDAPLRRQLRREIRRIQTETGVTMLYVTHDQEEALSLSDQVILMKEGRVLETGSPEELYYRPQSLDAAQALGHGNLLPRADIPGRLKDLPPEAEWIFCQPDGLGIRKDGGEPGKNPGENPGGFSLGWAEIEEREFTPAGYLYRLTWKGRLLWMRLHRQRLKEKSRVGLILRPGYYHGIPGST